MSAAPKEAVLEVRGLRKVFTLPRSGKTVRSVDGVDFAIAKGETFGLAGESGCGKTTTSRLIMGLLSPTEGSIHFGGRDIAGMNREETRNFRRQIQMVFQDPYSSLNPRKTVDQIVEEPLRVHTPMSKAERMDRVRWLLEKVGLSRDHMTRYPHEFSGGQRQRIGLARALATNPKIVIADEPVSALDVSVQAQVINLMQDLQQEFGLSYIFIAHDLSVVRHISDRIAVMYLGHVVEMGEGDQIYSAPVHPYSRALLASAPVPDPFIERKQPVRLIGDVPSPMNKPSGCAFRTRCSLAQPSCADAVPPLEMKAGRLVACPVVQVDEGQV